MDNQVPEDVYEGELIKYPGPWAFQIPSSGIILVTDQDLLDMAGDPDKVLNLATGFQPREVSLRQVCEQARSRAARTLMIAFDHFFLVRCGFALELRCRFHLDLAVVDDDIAGLFGPSLQDHAVEAGSL